MRQQHRLRVLQVGTARHGNTKMITRLILQCADNVAKPGSHPPQCIAQIHPDQCRNLVVAGAAGAQSAAQLGSDQLDQPPLQRTVHVLVGTNGPERSGGHLRAQRVEPSTIAASSSSVSSSARCRALACARDPATSYGASLQSKCVDRLSVKSASAGSPPNRPPHSRPS